MVLGAACGRHFVVQQLASAGTSVGASSAHIGSAFSCSSAINAGHAARITADGTTLASVSNQKSSQQSLSVTSRNTTAAVAVSARLPPCSRLLEASCSSGPKERSRGAKANADCVRHSISYVDCKGPSLPTLSWAPNLNSAKGGALLGCRSATGSGGLSYGLQSHWGSWNAASDARPARWLSSAGRQSAWVLFGVCSCAAASGAVLHAEEAPGGGLALEARAKQVHQNYNVIGIPGDGRCMFRAVCHGLCLLLGRPAPKGEDERRMADELREQVVEEFVKRRGEVEWFLEGDFESYMNKMRRPSTWGGEPELLMASHVLRKPITVYLPCEDGKGLIAIAEYGQEYGKEPIRVLYNGHSHYDALQMPAATQSKL